MCLWGSTDPIFFKNILFLFLSESKLCYKIKLVSIYTWPEKYHSQSACPVASGFFFLSLKTIRDQKIFLVKSIWSLKTPFQYTSHSPRWILAVSVTHHVAFWYIWCIAPWLLRAPSFLYIHFKNGFLWPSSSSAGDSINIVYCFPAPFLFLHHSTLMCLIFTTLT